MVSQIEWFVTVPGVAYRTRMVSGHLVLLASLS